MFFSADSPSPVICSFFVCHLIHLPEGKKLLQWVSCSHRDSQLQFQGRLIFRHLQTVRTNKPPVRDDRVQRKTATFVKLQLWSYASFLGGCSFLGRFLEMMDMSKHHCALKWQMWTISPSFCMPDLSQGNSHSIIVVLDFVCHFGDFSLSI